MPIPPPAPALRPLTAGRAAVLYLVYVAVFVLGGGVGAGVPSFLFEQVTGGTYDPTLYAIMFGVTGYIAYKLARRVAEG